MKLIRGLVILLAFPASTLVTFVAAQNDFVFAQEQQPVNRIIGGVPVEKGDFPFYGVSAADGFCGCRYVCALFFSYVERQRRLTRSL